MGNAATARLGLYNRNSHLHVALVKLVVFVISSGFGIWIFISIVSRNLWHATSSIHPKSLDDLAAKPDRSPLTTVLGQNCQRLVYLTHAVRPSVY